MSKRFWNGLVWGILFSGIIYFSYGIVYQVGYNNGRDSVRIDKVTCMPEIVKAEHACYKRFGWYK